MFTKTKTYLLRPESRKPLANGFLSIFKRVICRVKKNHIRSYYKCQVRLLKMEMMKELQVIPKLSVKGVFCVPLSFPKYFIILSVKLEKNFRNHSDIYLL